MPARFTVIVWPRVHGVALRRGSLSQWGRAYDRSESDQSKTPVLPMTAVRFQFALLLVLLAAVGGCSGTTESRPHVNAEPDSATPTATPEAAQNAAAAVATQRKADGQAPTARAKRKGSAATALAALSVKGRAPKTGYDRTEFGNGWVSVDGCDTGDRMLARDLTAKAFVDDCRVESGKLNDPYTAARITYRRGGVSEVDTDHVVALADAWQKGAQKWSYARRVAFAND